MAVDLNRVQPPLIYYPPSFDLNLLRGLRFLLPMWIRWKCGISKIESRNMERLVEAMQTFQAGKTRYLFAFRHPTTDDHFSMLYLLSHGIQAKARGMGVKFAQPVHSNFVYDRGIPLWAGEIVNWLFPRLGGIPIFRGKLDRQGLQAIRKQMIDGKFPISMAPEGGTNGQSELVGQLEPGIAQIGFWAAEDLAKAGRSETVVILPIGLQYEYAVASWENIDRMLMRIEQDCGMVKPPIEHKERYERLYAVGHYLVKYVSDHYQKFYPSHAPETSISEAQDLGERIQIVLDHILRVSESHFAMPSKGTITDRCRRLEQAGWDRIFRADFKDLSTISTLERGFADQLAKEANSSQWHMRIAESIVSVTGNYVSELPSASRYAETLLLIWRALSRVKTETFGKTPYLGDRKLILSIGEPISISDRFATYQSSRVAAKACVNQTTEDLQAALQGLVERSVVA
ncbi:1-acyl-sn-glycerol-3-phosphate acyltransferase [Tumidithrix elongata RA019]|uniref:1-acyl-sn-glycerol-3-phosphate acyltransferase n=1 Tax=Tumidithrix elongata BACA0141 TaxID=2716417 RepID=A0AAW9PWE0_9CYAN|nr:1-acyl-sn-glycerol-3-phosphate acyltransferase [Tumidithrix elongata RA019]